MRGDDGRVSLFLAAAMIGVLAIIGLAFDGAGQLRSAQRADNLAAEAARTGGQSIDRARAIEGGPKEIDEAAARATVGSYLAAAGVTNHSVEFPVVDGEKHIRVHVTVTYDRYMLGLFGFGNTVTVSGEATARALTEGP
ncbi:pilus assembly protein TadG-related protein [Micromonospora olivasterospora]|nr:pilus assembly protein TadG-related protein [Micromonospora olivasterospora]